MRLCNHVRHTLKLVHGDMILEYTSYITYASPGSDVDFPRHSRGLPAAGR